jgi:hypothetical protein
MEADAHAAIKTALSRQRQVLDPAAVSRLRDFGARLLDHDPPLLDGSQFGARPSAPSIRRGPAGTGVATLEVLSGQTTMRTTGSGPATAPRRPQ